MDDTPPSSLGKVYLGGCPGAQSITHNNYLFPLAIHKITLQSLQASHAYDETNEEPSLTKIPRRRAYLYVNKANDRSIIR